MAQFDVYPNPSPSTVNDIPFLVDVQSDLIEQLATRVVVPLYLSSTFPQPIRHLNPVFRIGEQQLVMVTQELAGIPVSLLESRIANLAQERGKILSALDFLLTGF